MKNGGSVTCEGSRGAGTRSQHFDGPERIEDVNSVEGGPLLAVAQAQLTLAVPAAGEDPSRTRADEGVVPAAGCQENLLRLQSWNDNKTNEGHIQICGSGAAAPLD